MSSPFAGFPTLTRSVGPISEAPGRTTGNGPHGPLTTETRRVIVGTFNGARLRHAGLVPGPLRVRGSVVIPEAELSWRFSRSSGPGGQSVNTTDSRVELLFDVANSTALGPTYRARALERLSTKLVNGVLSVTASEHRSQLRNREAAERRLVEELSAAIAPPPRPRRPTKPTMGSIDRRIEAKKRRSTVKRHRRDAGSD